MFIVSCEHSLIELRRENNMSIVFENVRVECYDNEYILSNLNTSKD